MDHNKLNLMYDILETTCKASPGLREMLLGNAKVALEDRPQHTHEFRFQGALGYGGKIWISPEQPLEPDPLSRLKLYVTCYKEDETTERLNMIEAANRQLKEI